MFIYGFINETSVYGFEKNLLTYNFILMEIEADRYKEQFEI